MHPDKLIMLYIDLSDRKIRKDIETMTDDMRKIAYGENSFITAFQQCNQKRILCSVNPTVDSVYAKIYDYKKEISVNRDLFLEGRRGWFVHDIIKAMIQIRYFFWIIWWYIKN